MERKKSSAKKKSRDVHREYKIMVEEAINDFESNRKMRRQVAKKMTAAPTKMLTFTPRKK